MTLFPVVSHRAPLCRLGDKAGSEWIRPFTHFVSKQTKRGTTACAVATLGVLLAGCAHRTAERNPLGWVSPTPLAPAPAETPAPAPFTPAPVATAPSPTVPSVFVDLFPSVRLNKAAHQVEFDAVVPVNCHDPDTPIVELELVCCSPDTREHESLLMTRALPSHIHAAMLAAGFQSGKPGLVDFRGETLIGRPPEGDGLRIELRYRDAEGQEVTSTPDDWIVSNRDEKPFRTLPQGRGVWGREGGWVFAGSRFVKRRNPETGTPAEVYDADGGGQVIGLTTFGSETIAWRQVISPETSISAPVWIARRDAVPKVGTPVVVRISPDPPPPSKP